MGSWFLCCPCSFRGNFPALHFFETFFKRIIACDVCGDWGIMLNFFRLTWERIDRGGKRISLEEAGNVGSCSVAAGAIADICFRIW